VAKNSKVASAGTPATVALTKAKVTFSTHSYDHDPANGNFGAEASEAMGVAPERVFKTLLADVDGKLTVAVVPVSGSLDLKALASAVGGKKAVMADPAAAERSTGYVLGGISPLGQRRALRTVIDESALKFATVFCSGGRRGFEIELAPADLVRLTSAVTESIGRD
jgi:Cys-tRNA(Pro)/Cys-tRNA(Cys) deacylase